MAEQNPSQASLWTKEVILLAVTVFFVRLGQGVQQGVSTNFFVHDLGLGGDRILWLAGIREIPGLALMFLAALMMRVPQSRRAAMALLLMGIGYGSFALVHSYGALIAMSLIASVGFHNWLPLQSSLGMALVGRERSGRVLGRMNAMGALASMAGMLFIVLFSESLGLRIYYVIGGALIVMGAIVVYRLPTTIGGDAHKSPRLTLNKRYWLFYVLTFFEGSRTQVFHTFGAWILVNHYGLNAQRISIVLIVSGLFNFLIAPRMGNWIDRYGERKVLSLSYFALVLCFVGYAAIDNVWVLSILFVFIRMLVLFRIGLHTYVNRIVPLKDVSPTLSAGVSINHITSVGVSMLAGTLLGTVGYKGLCWGAAVIIALSIPFALSIRIREPDSGVSPQLK
jgi:predicted MFS family arabinose efflux permease